MFDISEFIGKRYGSLVVVGESDKKVKGHRSFLTLCDCGAFHTATKSNLQNGMTKRCTVCSRKRSPLLYQEFPVKQFMSEYRSYRAMLSRCYDPKHNAYDRYGAANILVDEPSWLLPDGFEHFMRDMGKRSENTSLDRIDNTKGYSKSNCRWATTTVQNHNKGKRCDAITSEYIGVSLHKTSWIVQITKDGDKIRMMFNSEYDAAVAYDNFSEKWYGDRPNGTERHEPEEKLRKRGGITQDKRYGSWRVRYTTPDKKRVELGSYKTFEEAEEALEKYKESTKQ